MADITIKFRDGTVREFKHVGRSGGSYTKTLTQTAGMVVVEDEWGKRTAFPLDTVAEVIEVPHRGSC